MLLFELSETDDRTLFDLREAYHEEFQRKNATAVIALIDSLFQFPAVTNERSRELLRLKSFRGAQRHLDNLTKEGILVEVTRRSRNRVYLAEEIISVLHRDIA